MKMTARRIALGMGLALTAGCAGQQVTTDYSPATSFSEYKTFALVMPPDTGAQQLLDQRVRNAVQAQLSARGLSLADRENADLYVGYGMVDKTHKQIYTNNDGWGWAARRWGWRYWGYGAAWPLALPDRIETYTDGSVVVNMVDAKTKQVVWEGRAPDVVNLPVDNPIRATKEVDAAVTKLFTKYPPATPKA